MTELRQPAVKDIQNLLAFLPKLYADGFKPITRWAGGRNKDGTYSWPYPIYDEPVEDFVKFVWAQDCWYVDNYRSVIGCGEHYDESSVANASVLEIQAWISLFLIGERFCDGYWGARIEDGSVRLLLERLEEIAQEIQDTKATQ